MSYRADGLQTETFTTEKSLQTETFIPSLPSIRFFLPAAQGLNQFQPTINAETFVEGLIFVGKHPQGN